MNFKKIFPILVLIALIFGCATAEKKQNENGELGEAELSYLADESQHRTFLNSVESEDAVLRKVSKKALINSEGYDKLEKLMARELESGKGVGIAAPQVGVNRRLIIVQRLDKEDHPFEFYYNPEIVKRTGEQKEGWEGCLSIPAGFGKVMRWYDIDLEYDKLKDDTVVREHEKIQGFTAVIFQHEIDHLDGVLFIDKKSDEPLMPKEEYYEMRRKEKEAASKSEAE